MKRLDCLKRLAPMVDEHMLTVTSLSSNTAFWSDLRREGANFFGCNMGLCIPFALGLTAAFPKRKVIALDSDGSLMVDTSSLITVADVNPQNFVVIVFDRYLNRDWIFFIPLIRIRWKLSLPSSGDVVFILFFLTR